MKLFISNVLVFLTCLLSDVTLLSCPPLDNPNDVSVANVMLKAIDTIKAKHLGEKDLFAGPNEPNKMDMYREALLSGQFPSSQKVDGADLVAALKGAAAQFSAILTDDDDVKSYHESNQKDDFCLERLFSMPESRRRVFCGLGSLYNAIDLKQVKASQKKSFLAYLAPKKKKNRIDTLRANQESYFSQFAPTAFIKGGGSSKINKGEWKPYLVGLFNSCSVIEDITPLFAAIDWTKDRLVEGIFRISGNFNVINNYGNDLFEGKPLKLDKEHNVHNVTGAIKHAIGRLFEETINSIDNAEFLRLSGEQKQSDYIDKIWDDLSPLQRGVLCKLQELLWLVINNRSTKMSWDSLSTCVGIDIIQDGLKINTQNFKTAVDVRQALFKALMEKCGSSRGASEI